MTHKRPWPTNAKWARDDAAQDANDAANILIDVISDWHSLTETEKMRRIAQAAKHCRRAAQALHAVGAPIIIP